jgi:hypothetical protein
VPSAHHGIELVGRNAYHQVVSDNAAAHSTSAEECETTEHLAFGDVAPRAERLANAICELLVVGHQDPFSCY